jgi:hypothetical protein
MINKTRRPTQFGVCIDNTGYPASLEAGKLYPVVPDEEAAKHGYVRVVDESGEDYWHSADRFFMLEVPDALAKALRTRSKSTVRRPGRTLQPVIGSRRRQRG